MSILRIGSRKLVVFIGTPMCWSRSEQSSVRSVMGLSISGGMLHRGRDPMFPLPGLDVIVAGLDDIGIGLAEEAALLGMVEHECPVVAHCAQHHRRDGL